MHDLKGAFLPVHRAQVAESARGHIVLSFDLPTLARENRNSSENLPRDWNLEEEREKQERLHLAKLLLADELLVVNAGGVVDAFTLLCIWKAFEWGKKLRFTEAASVAEILEQAAAAEICRRQNANPKG